MQYLFRIKGRFILLNCLDISTYLNSGFIPDKRKEILTAIIEYYFVNLTNSPEYRITRTPEHPEDA